MGDFFQLPPVVRRQADAALLPLAEPAESFSAVFAHASSAWKDLAPTVCYLSEQHRQRDAEFLDVLAAMRANACTATHRQRLAARRIERDRFPPSCTRLFTHNAAVDEINQKEFGEARRQAATVAMLAKGPEPFVRALHGAACRRSGWSSSKGPW